MKEKRKPISKEEYIADPCGASSLAFWKAESFDIPEGMKIYREDEFSAEKCIGKDEPYFKLMHTLSSVPRAALSNEFELTCADAEELTEHINGCYDEERVSVDELKAYDRRKVFDASLWIAVRDRKTGKIVASGIAELDARIGEGSLEWVQVSHDYRRKGLGRFVVCELLNHLSQQADFVTVSGRVNGTDDPLSFYKSCGFDNQVIWHIVTLP